MSIASEIERLQNAKSALKTAIEGKGVSVPASTKLDGYPALVDSIEQGGGGSNDDRWYLVAGVIDTSTEDKYVKKMFPLPYNGIRWTGNSYIGSDAYNRYCWFEHKREKYFVDSFSDGTHTLQKTGSPVKCIISDFLDFYIVEFDGVYSVHYYND